MLGGIESSRCIKSSNILTLLFYSTIDLGPSSRDGQGSFFPERVTFILPRHCPALVLTIFAGQGGNARVFHRAGQGREYPLSLWGRAPIPVKLAYLGFSDLLYVFICEIQKIPPVPHLSTRNLRAAAQNFFLSR